MNEIEIDRFAGKLSKEAKNMQESEIKNLDDYWEWRKGLDWKKMSRKEQKAMSKKVRELEEKYAMLEEIEWQKERAERQKVKLE